MRPQLWKILFCISFGGLLPRISLAKPLTAHTSFISLPSCPFSSLGDDHHIYCHPGISFFTPGPDAATHNPQAHPILCRGLWSFSLCWKHPPHTPATLSHSQHNAPLWVRKCGLVTRALLWGTQIHSVGDLCPPAIGRHPWNPARQKSDASFSS